MCLKHTKNYKFIFIFSLLFHFGKKWKNYNNCLLKKNTQKCILDKFAM